MQHKVDSIRLDLLSAIAEMRGFVDGKDLAALLADRTLQLVLEREFEIIGEALYRLRNIAPDLFTSIPGAHRMIGMRNILAHGYDRVDYEILWDAATLELEPLRLAVEIMETDPSL